MRTRFADQRGVSLVEAMVTVFVLSLVFAGFYMSFESAQKTTFRLDARLEHLGEAQKLIRATAKDLRTATPIDNNGAAFAEADAERVVFYANLVQGSGTTTTGMIAAANRVTLFVDRTDPKAPVLKETTKEPDNPSADVLTYSPTTASPPGKPEQVRLIGTYIYNTSSEPVFQYLDPAGVPLGPLPLSDANRKLVRAVKITLKVKKSSAHGVKATTVESTVRLPNVIYRVPPGE